MPTLYRTRAGDVVDAIVARHYVKRLEALPNGVVEAVLAANPHLREFPLRLPQGVMITLPDLDVRPVASQAQKLWD